MWATLYGEGLNFQLIILGEGTQRETLEKLILKFNLENHVKLPGFEKNPYKYIKNSDLFVSSSRVERYPLAVAEALVLETPILGTKGTGTNDILFEGKYGMMVENSIEGLYQGLKKIIVDKDSYSKLQYKAKMGAINLIKFRL